MLEKKMVTFEVALLFFCWNICGIYLENRLYNFYIGTDIEKTIPVYSYVLQIKSTIIYLMLSSWNMLRFITVTAENSLPYCLL